MAGRPRKPEELGSLVLTEEDLERNVHDLRLRACDEYLQLVGEMYFGEDGVEQLLRTVRGKCDSGPLGGELAGTLTSVYREKEVLDDWTPLDIALFVGAITRFGRDWQDREAAFQGAGEICAAGGAGGVSRVSLA